VNCKIYRSKLVPVSEMDEKTSFCSKTLLRNALESPNVLFGSKDKMLALSVVSGRS
jgi:hypothetical protein